MEIKLGSLVRDTLTGFEGVATSRVEYINGCVQYHVQPKVVTKPDEVVKYPEGIYIDYQRLTVLVEPAAKEEEHQPLVAVAGRKPGGPQSGTPSGSYSG